MTVFRAQEDRRVLLAAHHENSARPAIVAASFDTVGSGEFANEDCANFGLGYTQPPAVAYSFIVLRPSTVDLQLPPSDYEPDEDGVLEDGSFPQCSGGVYGWKKSKKGLYTGAYVMVTVDIPGLSYYSPGSLDIRHSFVFFGVASKKLPAAAVAGLE